MFYLFLYQNEWKKAKEMAQIAANLIDQQWPEPMKSNYYLLRGKFKKVELKLVGRESSDELLRVNWLIA